MTDQVLFVLTERGSRFEADEARAIWSDRKVLVGTASSHRAGEILDGDVVVIGSNAPTAEDDMRGGIFRRYESLEEARQAVETGPASKSMAELRQEVAEHDIELPPGRLKKTDLVEAIERAEAEAEAEPEPDLESQSQSDDDPLEGRSRVEAMQYAASRWPGQHNWSRLNNDELGAMIKKLEAGD
jgi:hypothetical protein